MSKRIGIFTWWDNANYGGFLQALATQEYLKKLGHQPEMVNLKVKNALWYKKSWKGWIYFVVIQVLFGFPLQVFLRYKRTYNMIAKYLTISPFKLKENYQDNSPLKRYDILLCGSDQIWNPEWTHPNYLLSNTPDDIPKISYASSLGRTVIPAEQQTIYQKYLNRFDKISVREKSGVDALKEFLNKQMDWVVDPTLLLTDTDWKKLLNIKNNCSKKYIFCYFLSSTPIEQYFLLLRLAKKNKLKIYLYVEHRATVRWPDKKRNFFSKFVKVIYWNVALLLSSRLKVRQSSSPEDFVAAILNSEVVISDSFHALMFSTIFQKNVKIVSPDERKNINSRIVDFCNKVQYKNVLIERFDESIFDKKAEFSQKSLRQWCDFSKKWFSDAINVRDGE